ncbi:MAG TPA: DinB family protein [Vicinamibacterales bacterium]|nr:DinB family protein [Vicinamibacterales bacterium]
MELIDLFMSELDREVARSRRTLEQAPENKHDWKPHEKSMQFGYLTEMVATIPTWITMIIKQDELDVAPKDGHRRTITNKTRTEYISALEKAAADARAALKETSEQHLNTRWKLLAGGKVVSEAPRHEVIRDTINHWAHHRGQMTVYLRLMGATVPALYGPSADDKRFD